MNQRQPERIKWRKTVILLNGLILLLFLIVLYNVFQGGFDFKLGPMDVKSHGIENPLIFIAVFWCLRLFFKEETGPPLIGFIKRTKYILIILVLIFGSFNIYQYFFVRKVVTYERLSTPEAKHTNAKVALIGLDGLTWRILKPLMEKGMLPNLRRLTEEGSSGYLETLMPTWSPSIWTSIATGFLIENHGVGHFLARDPDSFEFIPVSSGQRTKHALWNIASGLSKTVGVVAYYVTWPAEKVNGFMISDRYMHKIRRRTYPPDLAKDIDSAPIASTYDPAEFFDLSIPMPEGKSYALGEEILQGSYIRDQEVTDMAIRYFLKYRPDLLMVYLRGTDSVSHYYWKYLYPEEYRGTGISLDGIERYRETINQYYIYTDKLVGKILAALPPETTVIIASDHGFETNNQKLLSPQMNSILEKLGLLSFADPEAKTVDWQNTVVYDNDFRPMQMEDRTLNLNLKGREPSGKVLKKNFEKRLTSVINALYSVRGAKSGEPFLSARKSASPESDIEATFHYDGFPDKDILINGKTYAVETFFEISPISGTHGNAPDGVFIVRGPGVEKNSNINRKKVLLGKAVRKANVVDITPTILYAMGLPVGEDMDGRVLVNAFTREYLKEHPLAMIPSYQVYMKMAAGAAVKSGVDDKIKDELRNLGYIN